MTNAQADGVPADVRRWDPELRRQASLIVLAVGGLFLVGALLFFGLDAAASGWFLWVTIAVLVLLLVAEVAIVATGIAREEDAGPAWLRAEPAHVPPETEPADEPAGGPAAGAATAEPGGEIDLRCPECAEMFSVEDTGERPLHTECPHCGAEGHVDIEAPPPSEEPAAEDLYGEPAEEPGEAPAGGAAAASEPAREEEGGEPIALQCPACDTQFEVEDTGERPLEATCPGCGRGGKLKT